MSLQAKRIYNWAALKARSPQSPLWLTLIFLCELPLFLPLDALLVLFCLENPSKRYLYAFLATLASLVSALVGYFLAIALWDVLSPYILGHLISVGFFESLCAHFANYQNGVTFVGSLLPLPLKAIALAAGISAISLFPFLASVFVARFLRFFTVAKLTHRWGDAIRNFIDKHFGRVLMALAVKIAIAFGLFWAVS